MKRRYYANQNSGSNLQMDNATGTNDAKPIPDVEEAVQEQEETEPAEQAEPEPEEEMPQKSTYVTIKPDLCNIRKEPRVNASIVAVKKAGDVLEVIPEASTDTFTAVIVDHQQAFVRSDLVE